MNSGPLPGWLRTLLGAQTAAVWQRMAGIVPSAAYLGGGTALAVHLRHRTSRDLDFFFDGDAVDLDELLARLRSEGNFALTQRAPGTLNGVFDHTPLQFLQTGLERPQRQLEPTTMMVGLSIAGIGDLLAMKLNALTGRAQLRDYFDLMTIEQRGGRTIDEGLSLFLDRYQPAHAESAIVPILLALGFLDDVADDPFLPLDRKAISAYWESRQPQIVARLERFGLGRSA